MRYIVFLLLYTVTGLSQDINYSPYAKLLQMSVAQDGKVAYSLLVKHKTELNNIVLYLGEQKVSTLGTRDAKLAYWINVYNVNTLKLIVDNYPVKSIMDLDNGKPWNIKRVPADGTQYSLDQIENEIIRPEFKDPRIHFALNCGAASCPPLLNTAYRPESLSQQLDLQTTAFLNSSMNQLDAKKSKVSRIFDWYKADFAELIKFINAHSKIKLTPATQIEYLEYDWALNGR